MRGAVTIDWSDELLQDQVVNYAEDAAFKIDGLFPPFKQQ